MKEGEKEGVRDCTMELGKVMRIRMGREGRREEGEGNKRIRERGRKKARK